MSVVWSRHGTLRITRMTRENRMDRVNGKTSLVRMSLLALVAGCGAEAVPVDLAGLETAEIEGQAKFLDVDIGEASFAPEDVIGGPVVIHEGGSADRSFRLIFAPEGYAESDMEAFRLEVAVMVDGLFGGPAAVAKYGQNVVDPLPASEDFRDFADRIRVWRVDIRSLDSGISIPSQGITRRTAFDFMAPAEAWGLISYTGATIEAEDRLRAMVDADVVIIVANGVFRASAMPGSVYVASSRLPSGALVSAWRTLAHELGHALIGLQDEYGGSASCDPLVPAPYESVNVAFSTAPGQFPWADMIARGTPIPTPVSPTYRYTVGAFEGALYCSTGRWRPTQDCLMRNHRTERLCPVCRREFERLLVRRGPLSEPAGQAPSSLRELP